jgi:hypothetical protein
MLCYNYIIKLVLKQRKNIMQISSPKLLTLRQMAAIKELDRGAKKPLDASAVMDIVGVISGLKPVTLQVRGDVDPGVLRRIGLKRVRIDRDRFAVSWQRSLAKEFAEAFSDCTKGGMLTKRAHRRIGALLGYPHTATEYFLRRLSTVGTKNELPMVKVKAAQYTVDEWFMQIVLSPDNYTQELELYSYPLKQAMKQLAPHSYALLRRQAFRDRLEHRARALVGRNLNDSFSVQFV